MSGYTRGPWRTIDGARKSSNFGGYQAFVNGPDVARIATVQGGNSDEREVAEANAHLIASAPDLLAALERIVQDSALGQGPKWVEACELARAAIERAKGGDK